MWLFDSKGFVSVVAYDPSKDRNSKSKFREIAKQGGTHLLVRSRIKADLDMLKEVVPSLLVEEDPSADYAYRSVVTRSQFKKFLADSVDRIVYDSHFKEAARDASPPAKDRYGAMMSVWSTMARLQDLPPYGGGFGGGHYSGGSGYVSSFGSSDVAKSKSKPKVASMAGPLASPNQQGVSTMEEFMENYSPEKVDSYRGGKGPRTGFSPGDEVIGYFGTGFVIDVSPSPKASEGYPDLVRVEYQRGTSKVTGNFHSNYLIPAVAEGEVEVEAVDLDAIYDWYSDNSAKQYPTALLPLLDDAAMEYHIRVAEWKEWSGLDEPTQQFLNDLHDEVTWETADTETKLELAQSGTVPEKYVDEISKLFPEGD